MCTATCVHYTYIYIALAIYMRDGSISIQVRDYKVGDLCPCVSLTCECVNALDVWGC